MDCCECVNGTNKIALEVMLWTELLDDRSQFLAFSIYLDIFPSLVNANEMVISHPVHRIACHTFGHLVCGCQSFYFVVFCIRQCFRIIYFITFRCVRAFLISHSHNDVQCLYEFCCHSGVSHYCPWVVVCHWTLVPKQLQWHWIAENYKLYW